MDTGMDNYPLATSVVDFYHAMEYWYEFADQSFSDKTEKDKWCDLPKDLLLASGVETVLENILSVSAKEEAKKKITNYYQNNKERMKYKHYRNTNGAINWSAVC